MNVNGNFNRRELLKIAGAGGAALIGRGQLRAAAPAAGGRGKPNILFINVDQLNATAISGHGCRFVATPNIDRLIARATTFRECYTANPVCCPARSGWFSGRPTSETGAPRGVHMRAEVPDLGQWLGARGYETVYAGKWHITGHDVAKSFRYLTPGMGMGEDGDGSVSRAAEGFLRNYDGGKPFFLTLGFLQPHDICYWIMRHYHNDKKLPLDELAGGFGELPPLPPNFNYDRREPQYVVNLRGGGPAHRSAEEWSEQQWRYYLWSYYRHVEMVDAEVGRVLDALKDSAFAKDAVVIFASDHGEGMGSQQMVIKGYLYDSAARIPLAIAWPGMLPAKASDSHLVSGFDLAPTVCDFAGVEAMPKARGMSLRPLLEQRGATQRDFVASESMGHGLMLRTADYKYICYPDDPVCQLFDMKNDPGETRNVASESQYSGTLAEMKKRLAGWEAKLELYPGAPVSNGDDAPEKQAPRRRRQPAYEALRSRQDLLPGTSYLSNRMQLIRTLTVFFALAAGAAILHGAEGGIGIQALVHAGVAVSDLDRALHFYEDQLGLKEAFRLSKPDGTPRLLYLQVNDDTSWKSSPE